MSFLRSKRYQQINLGVLIGTLVALPFSYHPLVSFGSVSGVNIDGSLLYIIVALAVLTSLPILWQNRVQLGQSKPLLLLTAFTVFSGISVLWSPNTFRGAITTCFLLLLVGLVSSVAATFSDLKRYKTTIFRLVAVSIGISIAWALWQIYGDALDVSSMFTLLPLTYQSDVFGVARPTGFALEPQFFASILLVPLLWLGWKFTTSNRKASDRWLFGAFILIMSVLLLTLSRGGIYASFIGLILLGIIEYRHFKRWLLLLPAVALCMLLSSLVLFSAASINQQDSLSGYQSLSKSLNHLTLGVIDLPAESPPATTTQNRPTTPQATPSSDEGYVSSSTESRTGMSAQALSIWSASPRSLLFGVGSGGFGSALHAKNSNYPENSIVNNYYLETLAETGIIGFALFAGFLLVLLYQLIRRRMYCLLIIMAALLIQLNFFSGNANIIHLWAVIGIAVGSLLIQPKTKRRLLQ